MPECLPAIQSWITLVYAGFVSVTAVLIVLRLTWKTKAKFWGRWLFCSNILLLIAASCFAVMLLYALSFIIAAGDGSQSFRWRVVGPYWYSYWIMTLINLSPLVLWIRKYRRSYKLSLLFAILIALPTLLERGIIIITSLYRDYLPSSWTYYGPSLPEISVNLALYCGLLLLTYGINFRIKRKPANTDPS